MDALRSVATAVARVVPGARNLDSARCLERTRNLAGSMTVLESSQQMNNHSNLAAALQQTFHPGTRKQAEATLSAMEAQPSFILQLVQLVQNEQASDPNTRFAAALYFKNFVKRYWAEVEDGQSKISPQDRLAVKATIVDLMIRVPEKLQVQLSDAVSIMAAEDFPNSWDNLIHDLVTKLSPTDYKVNAGVLQTAHSIFKAYRYAFRSNELFTEIKLVLEQFCQPFLQLFQNTDMLITQYQSDANALKVLFQSMHLMCKIYFSLNSQDIPEFFEDHQAQFMPLFLKYLQYQNPLVAADSEEEAGPLEKVKTSICEIVDLYAKKYEEVFSTLPQFVEAVWKLLPATGPEPRNDLLVSTGISFLSSVAKQARHRHMFEQPNALQTICESIVLPNMQLRESDVELFEDDPIEFIRRDLEGSDSDTRRRAATDFVRSLSTFFEGPLTELIGNYIGHFLQKYAAKPTENWKDKDVAIYLLMAITAKTATAQLGATKTNEKINIVDIFSQHILCDLQSPVDSSATHPVLKVDAFKFLNTFRSSLTKTQLSSVFPMVVEHLKSTNYVVHTYAAVCVERILFMKEGSQLMFTAQDIQPYAESLLTNLFQLIEAGQTPEKMSENDYLIKTVMRVIYISRQQMEPYVTPILERLTRILELISRNPSNPKFNHYVFESIGSFLCAANLKFVPEFEKLLFPPMQGILQADIPEFTPYVFQIMSQLLEYHKEVGIPAPYQPLLPPLLQPVLWESAGNIPALVRLLEAYLSRGGAQIVANNQLPAFLGIVQKLIASRQNDHFGFDLLVSIFQHIPLSAVNPFIKQIFNILLLRLQNSSTPKYSLGFVKFLGMLVCTVKESGVNSAEMLVTVMDSIQPNLFLNLAKSVVVAEMKKLTETTDRKICAVAFTKVLTETRQLLTAEYLPLWPLMLTQVLEICQNPLVKESVAGTGEDDLFSMDAEDAGYQSTFARLHSISKAQYDPTAEIPDLTVFVKTKLQAVLPQHGQIVNALKGGLSPKTLQYMASIGLAI